MSRYFLRDDVYLCKLDGGAVFLDLEHGKYYALTPEQLSAVEPELSETSCAAGVATVAAPAYAERNINSVAEALLQRNLLTRNSAAGKPFVPIDTSLRSATNLTIRGVSNSPVKFGHVLTFLLLASYVYLQLRRSNLRYIVTSLKNHSTKTQKTLPLEQVENLVSVFRRIRCWVYTAHGRCLFDALVMAQFLKHYGARPTFVIGVCTNPFIAHAWVQSHTRSLDEPIETLQRFTPILAV